MYGSKILKEINSSYLKQKCMFIYLTNYMITLGYDMGMI